jgi:DHA2 family multidrug resistance protein
MVVGLVTLAASLFHMTNFNLQIDFHTAIMARIYQAAGLAFLFVPINTAAYAYLPREKNNAASGLMNLARNVGGSVGISFVTTMLERRQQHHMVNLSANLSAGNSSFQEALSGAAAALQRHGASAADASHRAYALVQSTVQRQASMLGYIDCFWLLGVAALCMIPLVFVMRKTRPGAATAAH